MQKRKVYLELPQTRRPRERKRFREPPRENPGKEGEKTFGSSTSAKSATYTPKREKGRFPCAPQKPSVEKKDLLPFSEPRKKRGSVAFAKKKQGGGQCPSPTKAPREKQKLPRAGSLTSRPWLVVKM